MEAPSSDCPCDAETYNKSYKISVAIVTPRDAGHLFRSKSLTVFATSRQVKKRAQEHQLRGSPYTMMVWKVLKCCMEVAFMVLAPSSTTVSASILQCPVCPRLCRHEFRILVRHTSHEFCFSARQDNMVHGRRREENSSQSIGDEARFGRHGR